MAPKLQSAHCFLEALLSVDLLMEGMRFNLINGRRGFIVKHKIHDSVWIEIADADGPNPSGKVQFLHRPPSPVNVSVGLVDEIKVKIVELQLVQRSFEGDLGSFITGVLDP
jgi:hypothetical protein